MKGAGSCPKMLWLAMGIGGALTGVFACDHVVISIARSPERAMWHSPLPLCSPPFCLESTASILVLKGAGSRPKMLWLAMGIGGALTGVFA